MLTGEQLAGGTVPPRSWEAEGGDVNGTLAPAYIVFLTKFFSHSDAHVYKSQEAAGTGQEHSVLPQSSEE